MTAAESSIDMTYSNDFNGFLQDNNTQSHEFESVPIQSNLAQWLAPEPIKQELPAVPILDAELIPEPYRPWILDIAHRMQCPPDFAAVTAMVMTGAIIGTACGIKPKRNDLWLCTSNLYGGIVGRPSVLLKSPTINEVIKPITELEKIARKELKRESCEYEAQKDVLKAKRDGIKKAITKAAKEGQDIASLQEQYTACSSEAEPYERRYRTNDSTTEKLSELLNENPRGLLVLRDELTGLLSSWEKSGHEGDRAFYLEAWNGTGDMYTDRIGRGTIYTENMCLSLFGGIQPMKLQEYLYANRLTNDGMFQRFQMIVYPDELTSWELIDKPVDIEARNRAYKIIETLADMDFSEIGATYENGDKIPSLHFANDAQEVFYTWYTALETTKIRANEEAVITEHLAKYRKLMPALALIFHLIDVADGTATGAVSQKSAEMAVKWCDYLEQHARRIYDLASSYTVQSASNLARRIARGEVESPFVARDIYRRCWSGLTDANTTQLAIDILVQKHWLKESITEASFQQKSVTQYIINPNTRGFYD